MKKKTTTGKPEVQRLGPVGLRDMLMWAFQGFYVIFGGVLFCLWSSKGIYVNLGVFLFCLALRMASRWVSQVYDWMVSKVPSTYAYLDRTGLVFVES